MRFYEKVKPNVPFYFPKPFANDRYAIMTEGRKRRESLVILEKTSTHVLLTYKGKPRMFLFVGE